jgi:hypothetical protein
MTIHRREGLVALSCSPEPDLGRQFVLSQLAGFPPRACEPGTTMPPAPWPSPSNRPAGPRPNNGGCVRPVGPIASCCAGPLATVIGPPLACLTRPGCSSSDRWLQPCLPHRDTSGRQERIAAAGFNSARYTLDLLLPVANPRQRDASVPYGYAACRAFGLTLAGWLLAAVAVAGLTGVFKRNQGPRRQAELSWGPRRIMAGYPVQRRASARDHAGGGPPARRATRARYPVHLLRRSDDRENHASARTGQQHGPGRGRRLLVLAAVAARYVRTCLR